MEKERRTTLNDLIKYLGRYYKFTLNDVNGQLFYQRRDSKTPPKLFDRSYFFRLLSERFSKCPASIIRESLKAINCRRLNDVEAFFKSIKYLPATIPSSSPFDRLNDYVELAEDAPFSFGEALEKHFVRAIRSVLNGTPNRFIFTLVSKAQYIGKTEFIEWFFPPQLEKYCMSTLTGRKEKWDIILASKLLVNIDEFSGAKKSDDANLKAMLSQRSAALWIAFKNMAIKRPRMTSFFATCNIGRKPILSADDSNSRFLIYNIKSINWAYKQDIDIDELWQYAIAKAHDPSYDPNPSIKDVRLLEKHNRRYSKKYSKVKVKGPRRVTIGALGAIAGSILTALATSPLGRLAFSSLVQFLGVG